MILTSADGAGIGDDFGSLGGLLLVRDNGGIVQRLQLL